MIRIAFLLPSRHLPHCFLTKQVFFPFARFYLEEFEFLSLP